MKTKLYSDRGSVLMITLTFTLALFMVVSSYLSLVNTNLKLSHTNYNSSSAMNLADAGIEEAMWAVNRVATGLAAATAYPTSKGWTITGKIAQATFNFPGVSAGTNQVNVQVTNCDLSDRTTRPRVKVQSVITSANTPRVEKWVEIALDATPSIGPSGVAAPFKGLVAKNSVIFNGNNPKVDSFDSTKGYYGAALANGATNKGDHGFVGSTAVSVDQVSIRQADILGYVATYNDADLSNNVGNNGSILGFNSPNGLKIDPSRVSTDFVASLPNVTAPAGPTYTVLAAITTSLDLPRAGDIAQDGYYYYTCPSISLVNDLLRITGGNVVIQVTATTGTSIKISGNAGCIQVAKNLVTPATLNIYVAADVDIGGQGVVNGTTPATNASMQSPANFMLWGTSTTSQSIKVAGQGTLSAVIYAPNGNITVAGNGDTLGAIVGNNVTVSGNGIFHYDESLGKNSFTDPTVSSLSQFVIYRWRELKDGSERHF